MRNAKWLIPAVFFALVILTGSNAPSTVPVATASIDESQAALVKGSNQFACDLYGRLRSREGNLLMSPYSISSLCGMTYAGSRGRTAEQIAAVLHVTLTSEQMAGASHDLRTNLVGEGAAPGARRGLELAVANSLWAQQGYPIREDFAKLLRDNWNAAARTIDFAGATEAARNEINRWVAMNTKDMIQEVFGRDSLSAQTRLALVNAVYFKGIWQTKFKKDNTSDGIFTLADGRQIQTPTMHGQCPCYYIDDKDFHGVMLPYGEGQVCMVILLPRQTDGLTKLEESLTEENLRQWCAATRETVADISLPKFSFSSAFSLRKPLEALGMTDVFAEGKADLSGMTSDPRLFLSVVEHRAVIEVDEEGTRAAAASGGGFGCGAAAPAIKFQVDHPFLFLIRDLPTGAILFMGRVTNPKA